MASEFSNKPAGMQALFSSKRKLRARRLATVQRGIESLQADVSLLDTSTATLEDMSGIDREVENLLVLLGEDSADLLQLWRSGKGEANGRTKIKAGLSGLSRGLEARRAILADDGGSDGRLNPSRQRAPRPQQAAALILAGTKQSRSSTADKPSDDDRSDTAEAARFSPSEAALLAHLTEKFYGSWQFRAIALALTVAAALAGTGTLLLGGKELQLSSQLDNEYTRSVDALKAVSRSQTESLERQNESLTQEGAAFTKTVADAKSDIARQQAQFTETLRSETVNRVVDQLQKQLNEQSSSFSQKIQDAGNRALNDLPQRIADANTQLKGLTPDIQFIKDGIDPAKNQLMIVKSAEQTASHYLTDTARHRDEADTARKDAERIRNELRAAAANPAGEASKLRRDLDLVADRIKQLGNRLGKVEEQLHPVPPPPPESKPAPPPLQPPPSPRLTRERVCAVQDQLNRRAFRKGWFDGEIAEPTRNSIRLFQTSIGAVADGELTSAQVDRLIGTADPPSCSYYPNFHPVGGSHKK